MATAGGRAGWARTFGFLAALLLLPAAPASALTVTTLKDLQIDWIFGDYAPGGNCAGPTHILVDATGFTFHVGGQKTHPPRYEYALDYVREADGSKNVWFFPFIKSDDDLGPMVMAISRKPAMIELENNTGKPLTGPYGALLAASPFRKCVGTGPKPAPAAPKPAAKPQPVDAPAIGLEWTNIAQAVSTNSNYSFLDQGGIAAAIKALIGPKAAVLANNLSVTSPLSKSGTVYYTSGNADHRGGYDMAYVLLDAGQRAIEIGLWEGGKLTITRSAGKRIALPPEIAQFRSEQPPEEAVAIPGPPWEVRTAADRTSLAFGTPAASPHIDTMSLYCDRGQPYLGIKLYRPGKQAVTMTFVFNTGLVNVPMRVITGNGLFLAGPIAGSPLVRTLTAQKGTIYLRIDGALEGEVNPANGGAAARQALAGCGRF